MEVFSINSTEKFDMIVMFNEGDNDELDDELLGITEIKHILDNINIKFLYQRIRMCRCCFSGIWN